MHTFVFAYYLISNSEVEEFENSQGTLQQSTEALSFLLETVQPNLLVEEFQWQDYKHRVNEATQKCTIA